MLVSFLSHNIYIHVGLVMVCGVFINGPYAVITTAVSNDLVRKCSKCFPVIDF